MKKFSLLIRIIILIIASVMLVWVNLNFVTAGTYIGSAGFGAIILICAFYRPLKALVAKIRSRTVGKILLIALGSVVGTAAGFCVFFSVRMLMCAEMATDSTRAVVILGCQVRGEEPSVMLKRRLDAALEVLEADSEAICVVSGGQGKGEFISEAEAMRRYLTGRGIADERIFPEDRSVNTYENIKFSAEILKEQGITENIVVVTNEFHQYRAYVFARREGLETGAHSAATKIANLPNYWVREWAALFHQLVFGT